MFIAESSTKAKTWKQPKCPSIDNWIKMWYVYVCMYIYTHTYVFFQGVRASLCSYHKLGGRSAQWCSTLCHAVDCGPPGSSVCGILQARILEWVAMPSSRGSSRPRDQTHVFCISCIGRQVLFCFVLFFTTCATW